MSTERTTSNPVKRQVNNGIRPPSPKPSVLVETTVESNEPSNADKKTRSKKSGIVRSVPKKKSDVVWEEIGSDFHADYKDRMTQKALAEKYNISLYMVNELVKIIKTSEFRIN
jgi:hypothetical protein